jgi:hypothetical protein
MPETNQKKPLQNLSRLQYGDLRFIHHNRITIGHLRLANLTTLTSLAYRGYLRRVGMGEDADVLLTQEGEAALDAYESATLNTKARESDLTERCLRLLRHSRRVVAMQKSA